MQKNLGVTHFVSKIKRVENYPNFEKLAYVIQHGLQGFIVKNIESKVSERRSHFVEVFLVPARLIF